MRAVKLIQVPDWVLGLWIWLYRHGQPLYVWIGPYAAPPTTRCWYWTLVSHILGLGPTPPPPKPTCQDQSPHCLCPTLHTGIGPHATLTQPCMPGLGPVLPLWSRTGIHSTSAWPCTRIGPCVSDVAHKAKLSRLQGTPWVWKFGSQWVCLYRMLTEQQHNNTVQYSAR